MEVQEPKFKYEDKVFVYFDPRGLVDKASLPVLECSIYSYRVKVEVNHDDAPDITVEYEVSIYGSLDEPFWIPESGVYESEKEAAKFALSKLKTRAEKAMTDATELASIVQRLSELQGPIDACISCGVDYEKENKTCVACLN